MSLSKAGEGSERVWTLSHANGNQLVQGREARYEQNGISGCYSHVPRVGERWGHGKTATDESADFNP